MYSEEQPIAKEFEAALKSRLPQKPRPKKQRSDSNWFIDIYSLEEYYALLEPFQKRVQEGIEEVDKQIKDLQTQLQGLAKTIEVRVGDLELQIGEVYVGTYRSQGWGAESYAKNIADIEALKAKVYNVPVDVVKENDSYIVRVKVAEPIDLEILRYKPHAEYKEQIRYCLKNGINPKVYNPIS